MNGHLHMWLEHGVPSQIKKTSDIFLQAEKKATAIFHCLDIMSQNRATAVHFFSWQWLKIYFSACWNLRKCIDMNTTWHRLTSADSSGSGFPPYKELNKLCEWEIIIYREQYTSTANIRKNFPKWDPSEK